MTIRTATVETVSEGEAVGDGEGGPDNLMTLGTSLVGSAAIVTVGGELDLHTSHELMAAVDEILGRADIATIIIDLTDVAFLGSSGLGTLAELATRAPAAERPGGRRVPVRLVAPEENRAVIRPWEVMNLRPILPLFPDVAGALQP